ncbi:MAG: iron-containing alcohol dehydrogenase family protein [Defluviitaleaceae bacterium]|nr:iron-containing alcohol dehydrogenase family protein [Defluviitaleaceae bacterium]MCL2274256.1 iron-containing alcohol dehydrogenase family protein [Defluviitaleaceae bacterium]
MELSHVLKIKENAINDIFTVLSENNIRGKILFISDEVVFRLYGARVREQLKELDDANIITELITDNTLAYSMTFTEKIIAQDIDCIVGLGGGKVLDVSKYAAYISKRPFVSIPTTVASDGVASPVAVLMGRDGKPMSLTCDIPKIIIIDLQLILNSPQTLIKAGIGDTISNYMALMDWEYAVQNQKDDMNGYAFMLSQAALDALLNAKFTSITPDFIRVLADSHVLSGIAMRYAGSSRPVSGSEHLFSHALDYYGETHNLHGIQVALGTLAVAKLVEVPYNEVLDYMRRFEVDLNPTRLGISRECFVLCMQKAPKMRKNRYTQLNTQDLSVPRLQQIYDELVREL